MISDIKRNLMRTFLRAPSRLRSGAFEHLFLDLEHADAEDVDVSSTTLLKMPDFGVPKGVLQRLESVISVSTSGKLLSRPGADYLGVFPTAGTLSDVAALDPHRAPKWVDSVLSSESGLDAVRGYYYVTLYHGIDFIDIMDYGNFSFFYDVSVITGPPGDLRTYVDALKDNTKWVIKP